MEDWSMWAGLRPQEPFHWKSAGGRPDVSPSKKTDPLALALCSLLKIACFLKLGAAPNELLALTSGRVWTLNQHLVKSLKKPLKVWSYAKGTQERQTAPRANQATTEGHPQSDVTQQRAEFPQATQRHFNLKASTKQNLYKVAESGGIYL